MRYLLCQFLIVLILLLNPFSSLINLGICYILLFFATRKFNPLNPLLWIFLSWNILFINAFSGIIIFNPTADLVKPIIFCVILILTFLVGFLINFEDKISISNTSLLNFKDILNEKLSSQKLHEITKIFSIFSIIAAIFFVIEIVFINGGNLFEPSKLRDLFQDRDVTLLTQLSGILSFGGLFSISAFIFLSKSRYRTLYLIGIFAFAVGSILSAGRQMIFQLILSSILCFSIIKLYKIKVNLSKIHKNIFGGFIVLILVFFIFISTARGAVSEISKAEGYSSVNNCAYSDDFLKSMNYLPKFAEDFFVDYTFYFSHEIIFFSEWWDEYDVQIIDYKILQFSPFIERIADRLGLTSETQAERFSKSTNTYHKGSIFPQAWKTTNAQLLKNLGFLGTFLLVFFHGFFSKKLYSLTLSRPNFGLLNLSIANNIILFNTISNSAFSETQVLFYIIISIFLLRKNI